MRIASAVGQILALLAAAGAHAQGNADPLHSRECGAARDVLEQALEDASQKREGSAARLAAARKDAIAACLGREDGERVRTGAPDPPIGVAPPVLNVPRAPAAPVVAAPSPPPLVIQRPTVITTCDPGGCWDSNGNRLNSVGPMLIGPRGACTAQGGIAQCP